MARLCLFQRRGSYYAGMFVVGFCCLLAIRVLCFESSSSLAPVTNVALTVRRKIHFRNLAHDEGERTNTVEEESAAQEFDWDEWVAKDARMQSIGDIWDKCDNTTRRLLGKVVIAQNANSKGFHIEVYVNVTIGNHNVTGGTSKIEVKFKGLRLYTKEHELCKVSAKMDKPIVCPVAAGSKLSIVDTVLLPSFIPKGDYAISAELRDQDKREMGCVNAAFRTGNDK